MKLPIYTILEAAELLSIPRDSVYELLKNNKIKGIKLGSVKILKSDLSIYLNEDR
ncbi:helix-turn-helix domain-containing protein [Clostridium botulinum]|uniref:helix-turn-helix domain-containing protein n=1 Tax=Clostridium TaxID=1485 RepID=UPI0013F0D768|nr:MULTISPECIES: helix-turn-helix domain-containing protein [Clostridium]NFN44451.1 helix-turn-helix domain-containing protein [Clostridium botulinum]NFO28846.1 helix-turn-helix domain-containing protein [Clostridium botulinum]NFO53997.1 helix-turn-helix domain-containing protein [Clostridium botulinum]UZP02669.1 helix-turn-helix domain-containing protein [Clostridium botulinum]UZP06027.1 helix-turn-helix domain-containing protein [Clostridium botulinum]